MHSRLGVFWSKRWIYIRLNYCFRPYMDIVNTTHRNSETTLEPDSTQIEKSVIGMETAFGVPLGIDTDHLCRVEHQSILSVLQGVVNSNAHGDR